MTFGNIENHFENCGGHNKKVINLKNHVETAIKENRYITSQGIEVSDSESKSD